MYVVNSIYSIILLRLKHMTCYISFLCHFHKRSRQLKVSHLLNSRQTYQNANS